MNGIVHSRNIFSFMANNFRVYISMEKSDSNKINQFIYFTYFSQQHAIFMCFFLSNNIETNNEMTIYFRNIKHLMFGKPDAVQINKSDNDAVDRSTIEFTSR